MREDLPNLTAAEAEVVNDEIRGDPRYRMGGGLGALKEPIELVKLLLERRELPNPDPIKQVQAEPTAGELIDACATPAIGMAAAAGWITPKEAASRAGLAVMVDDPAYRSTILAPSRIDSLLGRSVGGLAPSEVQQLLKEGAPQ